ncbi:type II toxin-antitoxin system VapC family toxin [Flexivirga alba]|jgi:Uncharacterized protein conserved in bacteria|uniref:Type II toxin-antitoxin system VapC family toxin n=1 Tax=Flexivirga alba TaxID=702742 RepID=A0ABW2AGD0_9MICO
MSLLLDTHVLLWAAASPELLPAGVKRQLEKADRRFISAASGYEIAFKARRGKLASGEAVLAAWPRLLDELQLVELSLSVAQMIRAGALAWEHRDPFDRMLVAQAQLDGLTLITKDTAIRSHRGVRTAPWK